MDIKWSGDNGFWGEIHVASCFHRATRPRGDAAAYTAFVRLPAREGREWIQKNFDRQEDGRAYCQRLATKWLREANLKPS